MKNLIATWPLTGDYGTVQPGMSFSTDDATAEVLLERGDARLAPTADNSDLPVKPNAARPEGNPPGPTADKQDKSAATRQIKGEGVKTKVEK